MFYLLTFIVINLVLLTKSLNFTECDLAFPTANSNLNQCLNKKLLPDARLFNRTFLVPQPNLVRQKIFGQKLCDTVRVLLECNANYSIVMSEVCPATDEIRVIEIYSLQVVEVVHEYLCSNNMTKMLEVFENGGVRFMYENVELKVCAQNVPDINTITFADDEAVDNLDFCMSLQRSYECVYNVFEAASNPKLRPIIGELYELGRVAVQCSNDTSTS